MILLDFLKWYFLLGTAIFIVVWVCFVVLMYVKDRVSEPWLYLFAPVGIIGWIGDAVWNVFFATPLFVQWPDIHKGMRIHDITLSHRLRQILRNDTSIKENSIRWKIASGFCTYFIEPSDKPHCGRF